MKKPTITESKYRVKDGIWEYAQDLVNYCTQLELELLHIKSKIIDNVYPEVDSEGYELDEDGNRLSCCGDVLDEDYMICPTCKEHN